MTRLILALALTACTAQREAPDAAGARAVPETAVTLSGYEAEVGTALEGGIASWFDSYGPGLYAAVPSYRWGDPRYPIEVCRQDTPSRCVVVEVLDFCACPDRIVDLSRDAFARLEDTSRGLVAVTLRDVPAAPTPPQTDRGSQP